MKISSSTRWKRKKKSVAII